MRIIISSKNMNVSDHLKQTIESKLGRLGKYFSSDIVANVTLQYLLASVFKQKLPYSVILHYKGVFSQRFLVLSHIF
jgi:ribosomal subunit interface protein